MSLHSGNECNGDLAEDHTNSLRHKQSASKEPANPEESKSLEPLPTLQQSLEMVSSRSESSSTRQLPSKAKRTRASEMQGSEKGKVPGRWSAEEHRKFIKGTPLLLCSHRNLWEELEAG